MAGLDSVADLQRLRLERLPRTICGLCVCIHTHVTKAISTM